MYFTYFKQKDMKISKSGLLNLSLVFTVLGLWLVAVSMAQRQLYVDLNNAAQYMEKVQFISTWSNDSAFLEQIGDGSVKIETKNFILSRTWSDENIISGDFSSILWWIKNKIEWEGTNVIIGWSGNLINDEYNVILWWEWNKIKNWNYSAIVWWKDNTLLSWNNSVILWSDNRLEGSQSTVVWKSGYVKGDYSAALWTNSKVEANNSFLWTDGSTTEALTGDNLFVIMAGRGMGINSNKAHKFAKLTIWWPLIVSSKDIDENIQCGTWKGWWILKIKNAGSQMCLCSCNGSWRNSMLGKGRCISVCDSTVKPECGENSEVKRVCDDGKISFEWSWLCKMWQVAKWTWAFFMDKNEKVHWSCQTDDGNAVECSGDVTNADVPLSWCLNYTCIGEEPANAILISWSDQNLTWYTKRTLYTGLEVASGHKCAYLCNKTLLAYPERDSNREERFCTKASDICGNTKNECKEPFEPKNNTLTLTNHEREWICTAWGIEETCKICEEWYERDENNECVPITCHHCAHKWFPYCFPINFSPYCTESNRMN